MGWGPGLVGSPTRPGSVFPFLERLFGCPVDLVLRETIKPRLRETILKEALHAPEL
jgi:predicted nucleotidyltransferase